jgi:hypothetical protein
MLSEMFGSWSVPGARERRRTANSLSRRLCGARSAVVSHYVTVLDRPTMKGGDRLTCAVRRGSPQELPAPPYWKLERIARGGALCLHILWLARVGNGYNCLKGFNSSPVLKVQQLERFFEGFSEGTAHPER